MAWNKLVGKGGSENEENIFKWLHGYVAFCATMTGCEPQDSIVGTWYSLEDDDSITFYEDGTCYSSQADETAKYKQQEDGMLVITTFGNEIIAKRTDDIDQALEDDQYYYLSRDTFILSGEECERR